MACAVGPVLLPNRDVASTGQARAARGRMLHFPRSLTLVIPVVGLCSQRITVDVNAVNVQ